MKTEFDRDFDRWMEDPEFAAAFRKASRRQRTIWPRRDRGFLRLRSIPGYGPVPLPDGSPWAFMSLSDQLTWVRCQCPWWHRLPFAARRVHSDLP